MNPETTLSSLKPGRRAGLAIGIAVLLVSAAFPGEAEAVRRSCRATGKFIYTFHEEVDGSFVALRTKSVNILQSDMEVVASGHYEGAASVCGQACEILEAKKRACSEATQCFLAQASGADSCVADLYTTIFETIVKPPRIDDWRREIACDYARAGQVPGLQRTDSNTVKLVETKIEATASRDSVTDRRYSTVSESEHVCWRHIADAIPLPKPRPEPRPIPPPPASNDLRVPFQVTGGSLEVTPSLHNGPCPTQIEVEASLTVAGQGTVRFRLNHKGGRGPIRTVAFREGGTQESTATYTIGASGGGGGPTEGMVAQGGSGGGGIGGFQQNTAPNEHTGWFEIEIVSPRSPFKTSEPAHYKVVCKPTPAMAPVELLHVPGYPPGEGAGRKDRPVQPPAGAPDLVLLSAAPGRDGSCRLVVGNTGKQPSAKTVLQLSARGQKPIDLDLPPIPPGGRHAVPVKNLGALDWLVHLDRSNAVRESDEDNNRVWIRGCREIGRR